MVGVAENDLGAQGFQGVLGNGFDGSGGADGHKYRCFNGLVGQEKLSAAAALGGGVELVEGEGHRTILNAARVRNFLHCLSGTGVT